MSKSTSDEGAVQPSLSLVFPVFDEVDNLGTLVDTALAIAARLAPDFEIVLVDDGSRDGSSELIDVLCERDPRIRSLRHESNKGYGAALRSGLRFARGELVFFSDADLQFDLAELEKLLEHAGRFDIVAGYRSCAPCSTCARATSTAPSRSSTGGCSRRCRSSRSAPS
jgi:glycosyltransferase involved in cell wall biosynthesis